MDLSCFVYDFNLVTTNTAKDVYESCLIINKGRKEKIDYQDCISLYSVIEIFNNSYMRFIKDINELNKILERLGKDIEYGFHTISKDFISFCIGVNKPYKHVFDEDFAVVYFVNNENNYYVNATNNRRFFDEKYKSKNVEINEDDIINCLNIVKEHNLFLEGYKDLKNKFIFGNGTTVLFSNIEGEVLDKLTTFTITFGNSYMNTTDYIEVKFKLGESLEIIYGESKVIIDDKEIDDLSKKIKIVNELLSELYIHSDKLNGLYKSCNEEMILRKKDNNEK